MSKTKTLSDLKSYDDVQRAKSDFDKTDTAIKSGQSRIKKLRKSLADAERKYSKWLSSEDVPYEDLESVQKQIDEYRQSLKDEGETLKKMEGELPAKKQELDKVNSTFLEEAAPVIDNHLNEVNNRFDALKSACEQLSDLRSEIRDTPIEGKVFPDIAEFQIKSFANTLKHKTERWEKWK